jgi:hypothetical protein
MILVFLLFYFYYNIIKVRVRIMNALKETKKKAENSKLLIMFHLKSTREKKLE